MNGVTQRARDAATAGDVPTLLALLEGVFEAGERQFLMANDSQFDEAHEFLGQTGPFLLKMECGPAFGKKFLADIRESSGTLGEGLDTLLAISDRLSHVERGRDRAALLLGAFASSLSPDALLGDIRKTGDLLAWFGWCQVPFPAYNAGRNALLERVRRLDYEVGALQHFAEGLWLHDRDGYHLWLDDQPQILNGFLRWELDLLKLEREDVRGPLESKEGAQGQVSIEFFVTDYENAHDETVERVQALYSLFPFYAAYNAQGVWPFAPEVNLWHDPTTKAMTQEYQYLRFHVRRNETWSHVVESHYALDNYYTYQREWHELRRNCLEFVALLCRRLRLIVTGERANFDGTFPGGAMERTERSLSVTPKPPMQTPDELQKALKSADDWAGHWQPFRTMLLQSALYFTQHGRLAKRDEGASEDEREMAHLHHLTWHNFREVCKDLSAMQESMHSLFKATSDYFNAATLDANEKRAYAEAAELLDVWLKHPLPRGARGVEVHVAARRESERRSLLTRLHHALEPLEAQGITFVYPENIIEDFPLRMLPFGFSINDPCHVEELRDAVLEALFAGNFDEQIDYFWLVPTQDGVRPLEGGFRSASQMPPEGDEQAWLLFSWTINEQPIPDFIWQVLPIMPVRVSPRLKLTATAYALIAHIESFLQARARVELLRLSSDPYDAKLHEKHKNRLLTEQTNLGFNHDEIRGLLEQEFSSRRGEWCYEAMETLLNVAQLLTQASIWDEASLLKNFSSQAFRTDVAELIG